MEPDKERVIEMCNYAAPKQFAYVDPQGKFQRLKTPITNQHRMKAVIDAVPHKDVYESVYGWTGWKGGPITPEISKTAVVDCIFIDFDDAEDPGKALMDAAEVAQYVGHSITNFSGSKGAHVMIKCYKADLIPDLKGHVIRQFVNNLVDALPELDTLDYAVIGDTSRVHRIIDSIHSKTKLHAIGLTAEELSTLTIDGVHLMAENRRGLIQVPTPSQWVTDELYRIEEDVLQSRLATLRRREHIPEKTYNFISKILKSPDADRSEIWDFIHNMEDEWQRILTEKAKNMVGTIMDHRVGGSREETWLISVLEIFKVVQRMNSIQPARSKVSTSSSEHEARCHICHLMDDCNWTRPEMHDAFSYADDYDYKRTDRQINSLIGRN